MMNGKLRKSCRRRRGRGGEEEEEVVVMEVVEVVMEDEEERDGIRQTSDGLNIEHFVPAARAIQ